MNDNADALELARKLENCDRITCFAWRDRTTPCQQCAKFAAALTAHGRAAAERERKRIADRVGQMRVLRLSVGIDPLADINDIVQHLADDIESNWADYEDDDLDPEQTP